MTVSLIDIYPTRVEKCNLPAPRQELEGVSLASTLKRPDEADRTVYLPYMNPGEYTVMNRDWRYIHYDDSNQELYNVKEDPHEWHNLAPDLQYAEVITKLRESAPTEFAVRNPSSTRVAISSSKAKPSAGRKAKATTFPIRSICRTPTLQ